MSAKIAYNYLVKLLSFRDYSEVKLREKLREKKFSPEEAESAISELKSRGYLREDLYIEARIKGFMHKNCSANYIKQKLASEKLTVDFDLIYSIFEEHKIEEVDQINNLLAKKLKLPSNFQELEYEERNKMIQKAVRYAVSKGHTPQSVFRILKQRQNNLDTDSIL